MDELRWGVRRSYEVAYDTREDAEYEAEEYGGELVVSDDGGLTWKEAA